MAKQTARISRSWQDAMQRAKAEEVLIRDWDGNGLMRVKLRRLGLTEMVVKGWIPNPLIGAVAKLFQANPTELAQLDQKTTSEAMHTLASRALVEPTMEQLEAEGVSLTDDQYMEIYAWVLGGVTGLARFRGSKRDRDGEHDAAAPLQGGGAVGD